MADSSRKTWEITTHAWTEDVDLVHLRDARQLVGTVGGPELMHMVLEIVAYADDEAADQQRVGRVLVELSDDHISVVDDGRGTDTRRDTDGVIVRKPVMATRDVRFFGRDDAPVLPDGELRRGMSAVAASCEELVHENRREEGAWAQTYERGVPTSDLVALERWSGTGTTVRLSHFDRDVVSSLDLRQLGSFLSSFEHVEVSMQSR